MNGWIRVEDQLPSDGHQYVLVVNQFGSVDIDRYGDSPAGGECWDEWQPTHWMPLPDPPVGVSR